MSFKSSAFNTTKYLAYVFLGLLAVVIIIVLLAFSPLGVSTLVSVANNQAGLQIDNAKGSFYSSVKLGNVKFANEQIRLDATQLVLDIDLNCLFVGEACIERLSAQNIEVALLENDIEPAPASAPLTDYITLPIPVSLDKFNVAQFTLYKQAKNADKEKLLKLSKLNISLSMLDRLNVNTLHLDEATLFLPPTEPPSKAIENEQKSLKVLLATLQNYSYQSIQIPEVFVPLNATIKDLLVKKFCIEQAQSQCINNTKLRADISNQKLSANLATMPVDQIVASVEADIKLDIANQYDSTIELLARPNKTLTSSQAETMVVRIAANTQTLTLSINAGTQRQNVLSLNAAADVTQANLPLNIEVQAKRYLPFLHAWLPDTNIPIESLSLVLAGNSQSYQLSSTAAVKSEHASEVNLQGEVSLVDKRVALTQLTTSGDLGSLNANAAVALGRIDNGNGLNIDANINFKGLQVKPLMPDLSSQLNGDIKLNAKLTPDQVWGDLICSNISGQFQTYDLSLLCNIDIDKKGLLSVNSLALTQGTNTITGKGSFTLPQGLNVNQLPDNTTLSNTSGNLEFDIQLIDLAALYPSASGKIQATTHVTGQVDAPRLEVNANIENLRFEQLSVEQATLSLDVDIANNWETDLVLQASEIWAESMLAQALDIAAKGNLQAHQLSLDLTHPDYSLSHEFTGEAIIQDQSWRWQGQWEKGVFASAFDSWVLDKPTSIKASPDSSFIKSHCWLSSKQNSVPTSTPGNTERQAKLGSSQAQGLCIEQASYAAEQAEFSANINYNANTALLHYFPEIVQAGSSIPISSDIEVTYGPKKGINGDAYTLITQANLATTKQNIELVAVVANVSLRDQIVKTNIFAGTKDTGALGFRSELALDPENRTHKGQLQIDELLLAPLQRFVPAVEKLAGSIAGNIVFDGTLAEPIVNGELLVNDAALYLERYPYPVTNFNQRIEVTNNNTTINGEFELGSGTAEYNSTLTFADGIAIEGELKGAGMQLALDKNQVIISPNLQFSATPENFNLKGEVIIPNASVVIQDLPPSAKSASNDTIIIGQPTPPPIVPIGLNVDVRVVLDPPKLKRVTISAFDLQASLGGDLRVRVIQERGEKSENFKPMETYVNGSINILSGSYEAYSQNLLIQEGSIYFNGAPSLPQFDITAIRNPLNTSDNVEAGIRVSGNPVLPKVELFSNPSMIQARQLSYLLQGSDLDGGAGTSTDVMLVNALVSFGVGNSENGFNKLGKSLGFKSLNVQTAGQGENTQVQLTGRISDDVQVTYGVGVFDQVPEVILKYQLLPKLYLEAKSSTESAVDLFYEVTRGD